MPAGEGPYEIPCALTLAAGNIQGSSVCLPDGPPPLNKTFTSLGPQRGSKGAQNQVTFAQGLTGLMAGAGLCGLEFQKMYTSGFNLFFPHYSTLASKIPTRVDKIYM